MARKRRAPSPAPPPPPPPQQSSSTEDSGSDTEEEEGSPRGASAQMPPLNPQPHPPAAAAEVAEEKSDSDADAEAFQMRSLSRSPTKTAPAAPQHESDADEEEDGESPESDPEVAEPVPKKAATAAIRKSKAVEDKKRPAPEPAPSGSAKKANAVATPAGKGKKAKATPEQTRSAKAKKPGGKLEKSGLDLSPSSKSEKPVRAHRTWSNDDSIKILEAIAAHVKGACALPKTDVLLAAVGKRLDRKDCTYTDMYEKVRRLKERYQKTVRAGVVPTGEDELEMYNLSEEIWGEKAKEAIAAAASDSAVTMSKKGQANKQRMDGNSKGGTVKVANKNSDTQKGREKGQAVEVKTDRNVKSKLLKQTAITATQNGDALRKSNGGKMDIDDESLMPKKASTKSQNGGTRTEEETHEEDTERGASVQGLHRSLYELQNLYPCLAWCVERIEAQHLCRETLRRAFGFISDEKANALESKIKAQRISEAKAQMRREDIKNEVLKLLIGLVD